MTGARPVNGSSMRETQSEREVNTEGSLDIHGKVRQRAESRIQQRGEIAESAPNHIRGPTVSPRRSYRRRQFYDNWLRFHRTNALEFMQFLDLRYCSGGSKIYR